MKAYYDPATGIYHGTNVIKHGDLEIEFAAEPALTARPVTVTWKGKTTQYGQPFTVEFPMPQPPPVPAPKPGFVSRIRTRLFGPRK